MIETRPARFEDALALAPRLRLEDAGELRATWDVGPGEGLCLCLLQSDRAFALVEAGRVVGLWGVRRVLHAGLELGIPWLLAADRLFQNRRAILRHSRGWVDRLLLEYDALTNLTLASNAAHLRWLGWCGFKALRVHRRHGRAGVAFCEFYKVNPARHGDDAGLRESLRARVVACRRGPDELLLQAAGFAASGFPPARLGELLAALQTRHERGPALRPAVVEMLLEASSRLQRGGAENAGPVAEWCRNLLALKETAALDTCPRPGELALVLDVADRNGGAAADGAAVRGLGGLARLVRRYVANLTLGGRVDRVSGRRLRLAAIGVSEESLRHPLGLELERVTGEWVRQRPFAPALDAGPGARTAISRAAVIERLAASAGDGRVGQGVLAALQAWAGGCLGPGPVGGSDRLGLAAAAAQVADHVSRRLLPPVRLGGVVGGFGDRQHLYWLLRARLLTAGDPAGQCELAADIGALLIAARAEYRLIASKTRSLGEEDLAVFLEAIARVFGPETVRRSGDLTGLLGVLAPALAVPSVHVAQLPPALLAWALTAQGRLEDVLGDVSRLLPDDPTASRAGYRRLLRHLVRRTVAVSAAGGRVTCDPELTGCDRGSR